MEKECPVCRDKFSTSLRKPVLCNHCSFQCCRSCFRKYLLQSTIEPVCMSCKYPFPYDFLIKCLPATFWNKEYKEHRKNLLLSREESYLPDTQEIIVQEKKRDAFWKFIEEHRRQISELKRELSRLLNIYGDMSRVIHREIYEGIPINSDLDVFHQFNPNTFEPILNDQGKFMFHDNNSSLQGDKKLSSSSKSCWVHACPSEGCKGFLMGEQDKCPLCETKICIECLKIRENEMEHECKEEDVETTKLLKKNTKACPKCSTSIYKVSGCDQMWCVQCKTPFCWKTGEILNTVIHNPHYFEYLQRSGRTEEPNTFDCREGAMPNLHFLQTKVPLCLKNWMFNLYRTIAHTENITIPQYRNLVDVSLVSFRVDYLKNNLSKKEWKTELYRQEKSDKKYGQYIQLCETYVQVGKDWLNGAISNEFRVEEEWQESALQFNNFISYLNEQIADLNKYYKSSLKKFNIVQP